MSLQFIMGNSGSGKSLLGLYDTVVREGLKILTRIILSSFPSSLRCRHKKISVLRIQKAGS